MSTDDTPLADQLKTIWMQAVACYEKGNHDAETYFDAEQTRFLASIGVQPFEVFDFAEDYVLEGEPSFETFLKVHQIRRDYFLDVQKGKPSNQTINTSQLPPRGEEAAGIPWLPRILAKAKAKLRGEMPPDLMYTCGGDRNFLQTNHLTAEDFLAKVRDNIDNDQAVIDWVVERSTGKAA